MKTSMLMTTREASTTQIILAAFFIFICFHYEAKVS